MFLKIGQENVSPATSLFKLMHKYTEMCGYCKMHDVIIDYIQYTRHNASCGVAKAIKNTFCNILCFNVEMEIIV